MIYCSNCGKLIEQVSRFCRFCGAAQHGQEAAVYRAQAPAIVATGGAVSRDVIDMQGVEIIPPDRQTIQRRHLDPNARYLFFLNYIFRTSIVLPFLIVGVIFDPLTWVLVAGYFIVALLIALIVYNHFTYEVNELSFTKEYGIIHKRHVGIPFNQIQNVNIVRTLIDRMFGIARLDIETAGSSKVEKRDIIGGTRSHAEAHLPGISLKDAQLLHDLLLERAKEERS